jgi:cation diffusion facilitator CzcD-associated flavoprotein CzcO
MASGKKKLGTSVCVVGAGPCGLTALKNLRAAGLHDIVCYDEGEAIGGNWVFDERAERPSIYDATHLISSKRLSEFEDYPMPRHYPDFPSHRQVREYFENYAAHFGLMQFIRLGTRVVRARLLPDLCWAVSSIGPDGAKEDIFNYLIVCSGHHREPFMPDNCGVFSGEVLHSSHYRRPDIFRDKRVLVVGGGNSACDIAVDIASVAQKSCISMRRGYHIIPKLMFGRPSDLIYARLRKTARLPRSLMQALMAIAVKLNVGPLEKYGLQQPNAKLLEMHPTLNSDILNALRNGKVLPRIGISRLEGNSVYFDDGSAEEFDTIIFATGYHIRFPFLDKSVVTWDESGPIPLYLKMMHKEIPNVFFIGLFQPIGCIWRLADHQARIAALQISGVLRRPHNINDRIERELKLPHWRFEKTLRHVVEVDYHDFRAQLLKEINRAN